MEINSRFGGRAPFSSSVLLRSEFSLHIVQPTVNQGSGLPDHLAAKRTWPALWICLLLCFGFLSRPAWAQAPSLLWSTNIGARVFAADQQTNIYAHAGGSVIKLNQEGGPLETNSICPGATLAQRDAQGNYYFAGILPSVPASIYRSFGTQDFGEVLLSDAPVYVAKYSAAGNLLWATNTGPANLVRSVTAEDLVLDSDGNAIVAYIYNTSTIDFSAVAAKVSSAGAVEWETGLPKEGFSSFTRTTGRVRLTAATPTLVYAVTYVGTSGRQATLSRFGDGQAAVVVAGWITPYTSQPYAPGTVVNGLGELYNVEGAFLIRREAAGTVSWQVGAAGRVVSPDQFNGVHVAIDGSQLLRYDSDGNAAWTINLPGNCETMILDAQGNRFLGLSGGIVARLGPESALPPQLIEPPRSQTVLLGSAATFTVSASGMTPLRYSWRFGGTVIQHGADPNLVVANATAAQAGSYQVVISNRVGSITSAPATLRVTAVAVFLGDQLLTTGTYTFENPPTFTIRSALNGPIFYTLDGSTPNFASTPYNQPLLLSESATVRAVGYSIDFLQVQEADPVTATLPPRHDLTISTSGGGTVITYPPNCASLPAGLAAMWRGEGNALDFVGTNHGHVIGGLDYAPGTVGQAFLLEGRGGIKVAPSSPVDVGANGAFTAECWFKLTALAQAQLIQWNSLFDETAVSSDWGYAGMLVYGDGKLRAGFEVGTGSTSFESASGTVTAGVPHHAVLTYNKTTGIGTLYLDGAVVAQQLLGFFTPRTSDALFIGLMPPFLGFASDRYYPGGYMDEVAIYHRALSPAEVQSIYQARGAGKCFSSPLSGGSYLATTVLSPVALADPGYSFLGWQGDAHGANPATTITMDKDRSLHAVFGTTLSTTAAGAGAVLIEPPGGLYANGTTVRLTAIPQPGNYFGLWGNAASGSVNPLYFTISAPTQSIAAIFAPTPAGKATLTVLSSGAGRVNVSPQANLYSIGEVVTLSATPNAGQRFVHWDRAATGTQNPLSLTMTESKVIQANFSAQLSLVANRLPEGFGLTLLSDNLAVYQIFASGDLITWDRVGAVTNLFGEVLFTDPAARTLPMRFYKAGTAVPAF